MTPGQIYNPERYRQAKMIDLSGFGFERGISPTDIDFFIEIGNKEFVLGEFKKVGTELPRGQRNALTAALTFLNRNPHCRVLGFIARFDAPPSEIIKGKDCLVHEYWFFEQKGWQKVDEEIKLKQFIDECRYWWKANPVS